MSHLELAAILRAKAWRNYPGVFATPETYKQRATQAGQARPPIGFVGINGVAIYYPSIACRVIRHLPWTYETNETRMAWR